jgi:hypothetical protein
MPVLRFPHIPTWFSSGGRLTVAEWGSRPVYVQVAPTIPQLRLGGQSLPLTVASLSTLLAVTPRDSSLYCHKQTQTERESGASSPRLKAGSPRRTFDEQ